jgi:hypothetical protein
MRNPRQHKIDIAVARAMECAAPYLLPESVLRADAARLVVPRATETELANSIAYHDAAKRLTSVQDEMEPSYKLNAQGVAWLAENA